MMDQTWRLLRNHHLTHTPRRRILPTTGVYDVFLLQDNQIQEPFDYPLKTTLQPVIQVVFEFYTPLNRLLPDLPLQIVFKPPLSVHFHPLLHRSSGRDYCQNSTLLKVVHRFWTPQLRPTRHRFSAVFELGPGKTPTIPQIQDSSSGLNPPQSRLNPPIHFDGNCVHLSNHM